MSDTPGNGQGNGAANPQQQAPLIINGQYIKDLSFESPNSPGILTELQNHQPEVNVNVNISTSKIEGEGTPPNIYEIILELTSEMKSNGKIGYLVELKYAGVFTINVPDEHLKPVMLIECPRILFPFARQIVSDTTQNGGFMPLMLQPIDFAALYQSGTQSDLDKIDTDVAKLVAEKGEA